MDNNGDKNVGKGKGGAWWQPSLVLFTKLSVWIAGPIIVAAFIGKWIDKINNSEPWFFLSLVAISFLFSMFVLVKEVTKEYKKIEKEALSKKESSFAKVTEDKKVESKK